MTEPRCALSSITSAIDEIDSAKRALDALLCLSFVDRDGVDVEHVSRAAYFIYSGLETKIAAASEHLGEAAKLLGIRRDEAAND